MHVSALSSCVSESHCSPHRSHVPSIACRPSIPPAPAIEALEQEELRNQSRVDDSRAPTVQIRMTNCNGFKE